MSVPTWCPLGAARGHLAALPMTTAGAGWPPGFMWGQRSLEARSPTRQRARGPRSVLTPRLVHLGHRRRRAPRRVRPGEVPRRDLADDRRPAARRRPGADQGGRALDEGPARRGRGRQPGRGAPARGRAGVLQRLAVPPPGLAQPRQGPAAPGRLRRLPRRVQPQRPGGPGQVQVQEPGPHARRGRPAGAAHREGPGPRDQPVPGARLRLRRPAPAARARQPRDGDRVRGADPPVQRGEQRGGRRALHAPRRGDVDGRPRAPAGRRPDPGRDVHGLRRGVRDGRDVDAGRGPPEADRVRPRQGRLGSPLRPGEPAGDVRDHQSRPAPEGGGRGGRELRQRLDALGRRVPRARVRLHALEPALREVVVVRLGPDGRQGEPDRPPGSWSSTAATPSSPSSPGPRTGRCCSSPTSWRR